MGNYRFRLSDMVPNAWFYKLKDINKGRKQSSSSNQKTSSSSSSQKPNISHPKYTYFFNSEPIRTHHKFYNSPINTKALDTSFPEYSPRRSSSSSFSRKIRNKRKTIYKPSPKLFSSSLSSTISNRSLETSPEFQESLHSYQSDDEEFGFLSSSSFEQDFTSVQVPVPLPLCKYCNKTGSSSPSDIIIDVNGESFGRKINGFESIIPDVELLQLNPILTKPRKSNQEMTKLRRRSYEKKAKNPSFSMKEERLRAQRSPNGIKLRTNSPRIASKKINQACARKSLSRTYKPFMDSFAVVKSSVDPMKDFKESMAEMIIENNIQSLKDLEELLACYLSLNSKEYHPLIIKAFEQIWLDMSCLHG